MFLESKKINLIIAWFMGIMLFVFYIGISVHSVEAQATRQSASLTPHAPIQINSNSDFTSVNGISDGDGSSANPWIIENFYIDRSMYVNTDGGVGRFCIFIQDTSDYFIIRNSHISNYTAIAGIYLFNVSNGIIENNLIEDNYDIGIFLQPSNNNIKIINNTIRNHRESGLSILSSSDIVISNNTFESNQYADIASIGSENISLTGNDFEIGISIDGADPYIPDSPPVQDNQIYVWVAVIIIIVVIVIFVLLVSKKKGKSENRPSPQEELK